MVLPPHERGNRGLTLPLLPVQPAEEEREREEEEERSSVAELTASTTATTTPVAAATAASFSAGGAAGSGASSGAGGGGRARSLSVPLKLLGAAADGTEESSGTVTDTTGGTRTYGWNSETKCVQYSTDGGVTWTDVSYTAVQSNATLTQVTKSYWMSKEVLSIRPDKDGNYANTTFKLGKLPATIQVVDDNGKVATGAHVSIKVIGNSIYENAEPTATDFFGIDTVHIGAMKDENGKSRGFRLRMASAANIEMGYSTSTFLGKSSNTLFVGGGQLWLYNYSAASSAVAVYSTMYLGGCLYDDSDSKYSHRGLDGDIRAGHTVNFFNTIHLIEDARILGIDEGSASAKGVTFTDSCRIYGNGYDLSLGSPDLRDTDLSDYKGTPFAIAKGCVIEGVKSLVVGGVPKVAGDKYGSTTVNIAGTVKAGSLRVGRGSTVNIADNVDHLYFSNKGADYDAHDYALLLLKDATDTSGNYYAKINFADKATISCNTDKLTDKDGTVIGQFVGAFAMDVKDGKMTISGGKSAEDEGNSGTSAEDGNFGEKTSAVENLKLELRTGSALVLNDIVLGVYHNLQGCPTQHNALGANNVTIDLSSPEYAKTGSKATTALTLNATGASTETHIVAVGSDVLTIDYTGMSNLTFDADGTLLLDASSLAVNMSLYDYVAVKFDKSVELNPDQISITANNGQATVQTYYIKDGDNYYVYFQVPEPASAVLCLFGLAAGAVRRRRKPVGRA